MENNNQILFWEGEGEFGFLSNFSYISVFYDGKNWPTSEHAYQAAKFNDERIKEEILKAKTPDEAFRIGRRNSDILVKNWHDIRVGIMENIVSEKLKQNLYLKELLLKTGNKNIFESSSTDSFWGWGPDKKGENHMGKIWMNLREKIINNES